MKIHNLGIAETMGNFNEHNAHNALVDVLELPRYTFFLSIPFKLATPYLSHDDDLFHICDNPIKKEKIFNVPMVSGTWKGCLRSSVMPKDYSSRQKSIGSPYPEEMLFGNDKGEEKDLHKGRLYFFPTFFNEISLEVINPHDRKSKSRQEPHCL